MHRCVACMLFLALWIHAGRGDALFVSLPKGQQGPQSAPSTCTPACRSGFVCVARQCVSACNPPCPDGSECVGMGRCTVGKTLAQSMDEYTEEKRAKLRAESVHRHDGFYLRVGVNWGYAFDTAESGSFTTKSSGVGGFMDYAIGGNLTDNIVLALGAETFVVFSPKTTENGVELTQDHSDFYSLIGVLLDLYPNPRKGWHAMATIGLGTADINDRENESTGVGWGIAAGGGYDAWIAEQWSVGASARLMVIHGASDDFGDHDAYIPMLTASVLYH